MRIIVWVLCAFCIAGCASEQLTTEPPIPPKAAILKPVVPLSAFDLTLKDRIAERQVDLLVSHGYAGIVLSFPSPQQIHRLNNIVAHRASAFKLTAIVWELSLDKPVDEAYLAKSLPLLGQSKSLLLVTLQAKDWHPGRILSDGDVAKLRRVADLSKENGVRMVLYPHELTPLTSAIQAVKWTNKIDRKDVMISLNMSHEMKAGNRDRLKEIIKQVLPHLAAVTLSGADKIPDGPKLWNHTIQPLGDGSFDTYNSFVKPLFDAGYKGEFILQTFGLRSRPEEHVKQSMATWRSWVGTKN